MSLTTEQKINLLILAGFEPMSHAGRVNKDGTVMFPRVGNGSTMLWRNYGPGYDKAWEVNGGRYTAFADLVPAEWGVIAVDTIPDELIYEACKP